MIGYSALFQPSGQIMTIPLIQRVPALRVFWDLEKTVLHETRVSGTVLCTQGLIQTLGSMVIFDENQGVSDLSKYEFLCPIYVKIIKFLVI